MATASHQVSVPYRVAPSARTQGTFYGTQSRVVICLAACVAGGWVERSPIPSRCGCTALASGTSYVEA